MSDTETDTPRWRQSSAEEESFYWIREYVRYGMLIGQAETLAFGAGVDRHAVRETLEQGCDPTVAFQIFAP